MEQGLKDGNALKYCANCPLLYAWFAVQGTHVKDVGGLGDHIIEDGENVCCKMKCYCNNEIRWFTGDGDDEMMRKSGWKLVLVKLSDMRKIKSFGKFNSIQFSSESKNRDDMQKYVESFLAGKDCLRDVEDKQCYFYAERNVEKWNK